MKEKRLSVIVPLYNKEKLIRKCLDSFVRESFKETLEVIVIDDGSRDSSFEIALEYQVKYPDIFHVIHKENGGVGSVMNLGFGCATGKYVKEVDADDWVDSNALLGLLSYLENTDADIVLNPFQTVDEAGNRRDENYFKGVYFGKVYALEEFLWEQPISIQRITIKRKLLENIHLHETRYYIDMQIVGESILRASTCAILSDSLYRYRVNQEEQSVSLASYVKNVESFYEQTKLSFERLKFTRTQALSKEKINYFKNEALIYSLYLYAIFLSSNMGEESCAEFDAWLKEEENSIFEALNVYECIRYVRNTSMRTYAERRQAFLEKWEEYAEQQNKPMELYDVASIKVDSETNQMMRVASRAELLCGLLDQWMMNRDCGMRIENYFVKNNFASIAIYGMGSLGNHLYAELEYSDKVCVAYAIDKKGTSAFENLEVKLPIDNLEKVDVVVVTLVRNYDEVVSLLKEKLSCPIVLMQEVICES